LICSDSKCFIALKCLQGAERKMRDEERKRSKRRTKNVADSSNNGECRQSHNYSLRLSGNTH